MPNRAGRTPWPELMHSQYAHVQISVASRLFAQSPEVLTVVVGACLQAVYYLGTHTASSISPGTGSGQPATASIVYSALQVRRAVHTPSLHRSGRVFVPALTVFCVLMLFFMHTYGSSYAKRAGCVQRAACVVGAWYVTMSKQSADCSFNVDATKRSG